jgi:NhaP-type Na+/H+ and K+/H+ antiporter
VLARGCSGLGVSEVSGCVVFVVVLVAAVVRGWCLPRWANAGLLRGHARGNGGGPFFG